MRSTRPIIGCALLTLYAVGALAQSPTAKDPIGQARLLLDAEQAVAAVQLLQPLVDRRSPSAEALLLFSTAQFMLGDTKLGREALDRSLVLDPTQRQAWLNRAALDLAEGRYDNAIAAFSTAQELDPTATDNDINLGATYILKGDAATASRHFNRYLTADRTSADAYYLVASNYAIGNLWDLAVQHLEAAIRLDERSRRRSRTDPNFRAISDYEPFRVLLATDHYTAPADAHTHAAMFEAAYDGGHGQLLGALLNALQFSGRPFDPNVEVTDQWALAWSDMRLKVTNSPTGGGRILMTAPAPAFSAAEWTRRAEEMVGMVNEQIALLSLRRKK